ncbi:cation-translocating P-type ATPase [Subsaximicrobium wynnwilliamsii]|uniref:Cation-translocating P-type ATPase n=1 Tax=Subsaximicrobium wynnwilliamsii TaxID=291179 RepID=A0A5C6ZKE1_9FLAO|nr:cation-translocating P-type ATPase [Subsaximicrobium wynnwilliamsii]TXD84795.1 cation-translocating P-type ATPase [Subsaximicrobium wynnwilliamsii]TXD90466.1 cation-translocating P-type ATPase [Subsaximicrobium wynnwilliamsii]TXE04942.1 cation-translocating P-type ATPase [Subsaximicrobium wynnwilliamsii]
MSLKNIDIQGLNQEQVLASRAKHGSNILKSKKKNHFLEAIKGLAKEPMVILLLVAASLYFFTGNTGDGLFLSAAILLVAAISLYQDAKTHNALEKLKDLSQPHCKVIRNGTVEEIKSEAVVVGDFLMVEEGSTIVADGTIVHSNDFSVSESILTGESFSVEKEATSKDNQIYMGTQVAGGLAIAEIFAIGNQTKMGKIGKSIEDISSEKTTLELQINNFVKKMVIAGTLVFLVVWGINYYNSENVLDSLLKALTLAMSILPEEIPVAFATFMAIGAWRLMNMGVIVKQMKTVESLGSSTVICVDKTGTITENKMRLDKMFTLETNKSTPVVALLSDSEKALITTAMWASEPIPFDTMEQSLHHFYETSIETDERPNFKMVHEYSLGGKPPMMTHIFENASGNRIIAAKGAPEALIAVSQLSDSQKAHLKERIGELASEGYRVLGVGLTNFEGQNWPKKQQDFHFEFKGLVAFYDPPKENITQVFQDFYNAGIQVKIITGDIAETTAAIAKKVNFIGSEDVVSGDELMSLNASELQKITSEKNIFARMFPEAKLKIINALKAQGHIVAMTGDGVNDGPALKAAHIGVAMGKKGTEIAKQSASLVLVDDDLSKMVDAVAMGRKIYFNLKKAIQYIISIHIPIILAVFIPLVLGWVYPNIFTPIHVILLELIMGPTCSIVYENEPLEKNSMLQKPRPFSSTFFNWSELFTSIIQGLAITIGVLAVYQIAVNNLQNEAITRTMVFTALISANIVLTLVNRSFIYSIFTTFKYKNRLVPIMIGITVSITLALLFIPPFTEFFGFERLSIEQIGISVGIGMLSTLWYEIVKWWKRQQLAKD